MFGRKRKAALAALPPQHRALATDHVLAVAQAPAGWDQLWASLAHHDELVKHAPLPPRVRGVLLPLVRALSQDVDPDGSIGVTIDLRGAEAPGKVHPGRTLAPVHPVTHIEETVCWDPWLVVQAGLRNDATLDVTVVDITRVHQLRKRSRSGKTKFKTKRKATQRLTVVLKTAKGAVVVPPPPSPATQWLRVSAAPKGERFVVTAKGKFPLAAPADDAWQLRTILLAIAEAIRWVPAPADGSGEQGDAAAPVPAPPGAPA